jgi:hypothetical protein
MIDNACGVPGDIDPSRINEPRERRRFISAHNDISAAQPEFGTLTLACGRGTLRFRVANDG